MMKTKALSALFSLILIAIGFMGCQPEENPELLALKEKVKEDSLAMVKLQQNIDNINFALDSASILKSILKDAPRMSREDAISKIRAIDSLLTETLNQVDQVQLSSESNNPIKALINETLREKARLATEQKAYYNKVEEELEALRQGIVDMRRVIDKKDKELLEKDNIIQQLAQKRQEVNKELEDAVRRLRNTEVLIVKANKSMEDAKEQAKKQKAEIFFDAGNSLREEFERLDEKTISVGTKKARKSLVEQAISYYEQAASLGHSQAQTRLQEMRTERRYKRFLD